MDDVGNPYKNFNKAFKMFVRDLMRAYPNHSEFKLMHTGYKMIKTVNKRLVHSLFKSTMKPYYEQILKKDDSFFLTPDFTIPDDFSAIYKAMVPIFIRLWKESETNREAVWNHMHVLIALSKKCDE